MQTKPRRKNKPGAGRPRVPKEMQLTRRHVLNISATTDQALRQYAMGAGFGRVSDALRKIVIDALK